MLNLEEQVADFSTKLLEHQHYFMHEQPIINFIQKQAAPKSKKIGICGWNQHQNDNEDNFLSGTCNSSGFQTQKNRIQQFLSTIRSKKSQFNRFRSKIYNRKKNSSFDKLNDQQKNQIFLHLNSTIISFPKSRSQSRPLQIQQKVMLQKLYRKRQKSKIIPKQISINPTNATVSPFAKSQYPAKDYLAKNRSFIHEINSVKIYNPQSKEVKELPGIRKKYSSSYYKKLTGVWQSGGKNEPDKVLDKKCYEYRDINNLSNLSKNQSQQAQKSPGKMYKTLYATNLRSNHAHIQNINEFSILKIREDAKNTHLNRIKNSQKNDIQLLGSTITQWKFQAQQKLKGVNEK